MSDRGDRDNRKEGDKTHLQFLDLELSKAMYGEATQIARAAFRELIRDKIKEKLEQRMSETIDSLADLAVDDLVSDIDANNEIERQIKDRADKKLAQEKKLKSIFGLGE